MEKTAVILGGGYAGVMAANRMAGHGLRILLVNPDGRFTERIRLHEYAAGSRDDPTLGFATLLNPEVELIRGTAVRIDAGAGRVDLEAGALDFDYLVYAVGSGQGPAPDGTVAVDRLEGAAQARARLRKLAPGDGIAIVGGGLTAVETAAEVARQYPRNPVSLYTGTGPAQGISAAAGSRLVRSLTAAGIRIHTGTQIEPGYGTGGGGRMAGKEGGFGGGCADDGLRADAGTGVRLPQPAGLVLWCTGFRAPQLAARSGLPVDDGGRLLVDATLRVPGQDRIFGAGDAAVIAVDGYAHLRRSCATAMPMGAEAGGNILRSVAGEPLRRHNSGFRGVCISLGRTDGTVQFVTAGDTPQRLHLHGRTAAVLKEVICRMTIRWIRGEAKKSGAYTWPSGPRLSSRPVPPAIAGTQPGTTPRTQPGTNPGTNPRARTDRARARR